MKRYVLDSFAVLAYLYNEDGAHKVKGVLVQALNDKAEIFITAVNWAEVAYISKRKSGVAGWQAAASSLTRLPIEIVPADIELANIASEFKYKYKLSLADAFAAALSKSKKAELLTGDPEFKQVEKEIGFNWILD
ncbi:MAG: type II toxin-antitoxin system VapC family toxin [Victivallales bacterium]|jgi:predicted nucleic acid-binding protein